MSAARGLASLLCAATFALAGCAGKPRPAPVVDRSQDVPRAPAAKPSEAAKPADVAKPGPGKPVPDWRPRTYTVKRGDTLYSIALDHGLDYRDLVAWNGITNVNVIRIGQTLMLTAPGTPSARPGMQAAQPPSATASGTVASAVDLPAPVQGREMMPGDRAPAPPTGVPLPPPGAAAKPPAATSESRVLTEPRAVRLPYSDAALAQLQNAPATAAVKPKPETSPPAVAETRPPARPEAAPAEGDEEGVAWAWPAKGKVVAQFNESGGSKGMQIAGEMGQPVFASAAGRVVYSGSGLRGYGNLIIIKHNNTYLSAYAHNSSVLVREGQSVARGQKIAEMGSSDAERVKLHFEIRRLGKPVDPARYLPAS